MSNNFIKEMTSSNAASWLIENYPIDSKNYWESFDLIKSRSWKKADQIKLADYYLQKIPFASKRPYEIFLSFMSVSSFLSSLKRNIPTDFSDVNLLVYHLRPVLENKAISDNDIALVRDFLNIMKID